MTVHKARPRHLLNLGLTLVTAGTWLPIWAIFSIKTQPWRCLGCQMPVSAPVTPAARPPRRFFRGHFTWYRELSPWRFFIAITVEGFLMSVAAAVIVRLCIQVPKQELGESAGSFFILAVLFAPIIETLLGQALPISLLRWWRAPFALQVAVSTLLFGLPHFQGGVVSGIAAGLVGGFYLAFAYAHWAGRSTWTALWITAGSHAAHNYIIFCFALLGGRL